MYLLLDTSTSICRVTIVTSDEKMHNYEWLAERNLAEGLLRYLTDIASEYDCSLSEMSGLGVFRGPGSFTGLRIGMSVINTLAHFEAIPVVGSTGDDWKDRCISRLMNNEDDGIILPEYGRKARITLPRK